ncbi:MAG: DNA/RNA non-specific endonuclease [Bacteroidales bacterium]|nr:DNA/RNA non-specific endonuclease [Bacteroidales bacterium]
MSRSAKIFITVLAILSLALLLYFIFGRKASATTSDSDPQQVESSEGASRWLELPAYKDGESGRYVVTHTAEMGGRLQRNYTLLYDEGSYAALWVAYPLCKDHISSGREETWGYDPHIPRKAQTSVSSGYGASEPTENYPKNFYARGHQIPNADRSAVPHMQAQTYFSSNMTPQIQNGFNGGVWAKLESAVRDRIPATDTLYVVTGAVFSRYGEDEPVKTIVNKNDSKPLPVPNYYWKALLKVTRSAGQIIDAKTIGFWLPHGDLKGHSYSEYVVTVDQIEQWTGLDLFPNLSDTIETSAESYTSWRSF